MPYSSSRIGKKIEHKGRYKTPCACFRDSLIERVIRSVLPYMDEIFVVTGYKNEVIDKFLIDLSKKIDIKISIIQKPYWQQENGISVLQAKDTLKEPFLF